MPSTSISACQGVSRNQPASRGRLSTRSPIATPGTMLGTPEPPCGGAGRRGMPVVSGHPEERRGSILRVLPRFWACFSPVWVVFGVGAIGGIVQRLAAQSGRKVWKNWEKTCQAKSRKCLKLQIFAVRPFVAAHTTGTSARLQSFSGNSLCKQLFFYN